MSAATARASAVAFVMFRNDTPSQMVARRRFVAFLTALALTHCAPHRALPAGFTAIETMAVHPDRSSERVPIHGAHQRWRKLTVLVSGRPLFIERVTIEYTNDDAIEFAVHQRIEAASTTDVFDLPANYHPIRAVSVYFRPESSFGHELVRVHIYGWR